jgi:tagatose 1,6-diphosphate aldolase
VRNSIAARLTPGKLAGLKAVSDERAVVAALALDQRGILKKAIAREKGVADVPNSAVVEFKKLVTAALTKHASGILLDPEYGLKATRLRDRKGLFIAYEKSCYGAPLPRMPELYDTWSVRRLKHEVGADCIKVLLHYTPFDDPQINEKKKIWVERVGDECRANDIPFVLEILGYSATGEDEKGLPYAQGKPRMVALSVEEFSKPEYAVDMLKIEVPIEMRFVPGTSLFSGEQAYSRAAAQKNFRNIDSATSKPYLYLSGGVTNQQFVEMLEFAAESGSRFNGVLCGRATWWDGVRVFAQLGAKALEEWLETYGTKNISRLNQVLKSAQPWTEKLERPTYAGV